MPTIKHNLTKVAKRKLRVRSKLHGNAERPRVTVFRSNKYIYLQAIDDTTGTTIASAHDVSVSKEKNATGTKTERATQAAVALATALKKQKVTAAVFDRGAYKYHGRVSAVAQALREQGIKV